MFFGTFPSLEGALSNEIFGGERGGEGRDILLSLIRL